MPLAWEEVSAELDPMRFTVRTVPTLLSSRADPWARMATLRQHLPQG
jgi:DNA primase